MSYYFLGECKEISAKGGKFKLENFVLLAYENGEHLLALPSDTILGSARRPSTFLSDRYFDFHGRQFNAMLEIDFPEEEFTFFGKATSILYLSDKLHGGGNGKANLFRHPFGATIHCWTTENYDAFILGGKNLRVTKRGIEH